MWPTLLSLGPLSIHTFGVLIFLGVFFGGFKLWQKAKEEGWDEVGVMDTWLLAGIGALIASRLGFILLHWAEFNQSWYKILFITKFPGLSAEGAWLGASAVLILAGLKKRLDLWLWLEAVIPSLLIFEALARLGSFFAGSNLGRVALSGWGLPFPGVDGLRWPVQLVWVLMIWLAYLMINYWERHYRNFNWKTGVLAGAYLALIGVLKLGLGFFEDHPFEWWGVGLALAGGLILLFRSGITINTPRSVKKKKLRRFDYV
ncbi:MAG: prolipoprotein diacylglyceryl transferase [Candidatus Beckwithbacteria bacterium]|nr:prolipoprotein diacylglyceryl transferase [Candidatus Beckwithbacteria bacterium]